MVVREHALVFDTLFHNHQFGHVVQTFGIHSQVMRHRAYYGVQPVERVGRLHARLGPRPC